MDIAMKKEREGKNSRGIEKLSTLYYCVLQQDAKDGFRASG
jgi:hypothetical protein